MLAKNKNKLEIDWWKFCEFIFVEVYEVKVTILFFTSTDKTMKSSYLVLVVKKRKQKRFRNWFSCLKKKTEWQFIFRRKKKLAK